MSQLDTPRRLKVDNITEENRRDFRALADIYNYFIEQVTNVVNGDLDTTNLNREIVTVDVTVDVNGNVTADGNFGAEQGYIGCNVTRVDDLTNPNRFPLGAPFASFTALNNGQNLYRVRHVTGLRPNTRYRLVLELLRSI